MQLSSLKISNFRGIKSAHIKFDGHTVLIGDNNAGKSTVLEAIDLVLGPDRLSRMPIIVLSCYSLSLKQCPDPFAAHS